MLIYQVIIAVLVAFMYLILVAQSGKIKILKEARIKDRKDYQKIFEEISKRITRGDGKLEDINRALFVSVRTDSNMKFDERVSIGTILSNFMDHMGYKVEMKEMVISKSKEKGESYEETEREKTKRSQSKEKES